MKSRKPIWLPKRYRGTNKNTNGTTRRLPKAGLPCRVCGKVFKTDDGLTHHMKNKHGDKL